MNNLGFLSVLKSLVMKETHDLAVLFFEFEEVLVVAVGFMIVLIYLFYVKYPYNKDIE
ncbi:hypothetical protein KAV47_02400 [Candidatus Bathyarchaeota archaeon]|nr:hypothetical protein [Candidatus Bathyarchaeota archaeon]